MTRRTRTITTQTLFGKLWRLLTDLKGIIVRRKRAFRCIYKLYVNLRIKKCVHNRWLLEHAIFEHCPRISLQKQIEFAKPVHMGRRSTLLSKKSCRKSLDAVPFNGFTFYFLFFQWHTNTNGSDFQKIVAFDNKSKNTNKLCALLKTQANCVHC